MIISNDDIQQFHKIENRQQYPKFGAIRSGSSRKLPGGVGNERTKSPDYTCKINQFCDIFKAAIFNF
jgi:hypothetical protein